MGPGSQTFYLPRVLVSNLYHSPIESLSLSAHVPPPVRTKAWNHGALEDKATSFFVLVRRKLA